MKTKKKSNHRKSKNHTGTHPFDCLVGPTVARGNRLELVPLSPRQYPFGKWASAAIVSQTTTLLLSLDSRGCMADTAICRENTFFFWGHRIFRSIYRFPETSNTCSSVQFPTSLGRYCSLLSRRDMTPSCANLPISTGKDCKLFRSTFKLVSFTNWPMEIGSSIKKFSVRMSSWRHSHLKTIRE